MSIEKPLEQAHSELDALPLPEPFMLLHSMPHLYKLWVAQIRAARREGYEVAMRVRSSEGQAGGEER